MPQNEIECESEEDNGRLFADFRLNKHDRMKALGRKILFYFGVPQDEVVEEYSFTYSNKTYRVDLVGYPVLRNIKRGVHRIDYQTLDDRFAIAIECGDCKAEKLEAIRNSFALSLLLPYNEFDPLNDNEIQIMTKVIRGYEEQYKDSFYWKCKINELKGQTEKELRDWRDRVNSDMTECNQKIQEFEQKVEAINQIGRNIAKYSELFREFADELNKIEKIFLR